MLFFCGKKMWTKSLKEWSLALFVTQFFVLRPTRCQTYSARLATTSSTRSASTSGSRAVVNRIVFSASSPGAVTKFNSFKVDSNLNIKLRSYSNYATQYVQRFLSTAKWKVALNQTFPVLYIREILLEYRNHKPPGN